MTYGTAELTETSQVNDEIARHKWKDNLLIHAEVRLVARVINKPQRGDRSLRLHINRFLSPDSPVIHIENQWLESSNNMASEAESNVVDQVGMFQ